MSDGGFLGRHLRPLLEQRDATVELMTSKVQDEIADYRTFGSADEEAEWIAGLGLLLDLFLTLVSEQRWLAPTEARAIRAIGATRADQGFEIGPLRASVRIAVGVARSLVIDEYEPAGHDDRAAMQEVLRALDRFSHTVEDLLQQGHSERQAEVRSRAGEGIDRLIHDVLKGTVVDDAVYSSRVESLQCDPSVGRGIFLMADGGLAAQLADLARSKLPGLRVIDKRVPIPHSVLLVPVPIPASWSEVVRQLGELAGSFGTTVLTVGHFTSPRDAHLGYVGCVSLVPFVNRLAEGKPVLDGSDLTLHRLVASLPDAVRASLQHEVFRGLDACDPTEAATHLENLGLFVTHDFHPPRVREATGRDIRTVYKTAGKLSELTSRSLSDSANRTVLTLAFVARQLG